MDYRQKSFMVNIFPNKMAAHMLASVFWLWIGMYAHHKKSPVEGGNED